MDPLPRAGRTVVDGADETSTAPRRERNRLRTARALERAALGLFAERGYDATTVEDITERADVSLRTFFRYFASKDDVVFAWGSHELDLLVVCLSARPADEAPWRTLSEGYAACAELLEARDHDALLERHRLVMATPQLLARTATQNTVWRRAVGGVLAERSGLAPSDLSVQLLANMAQTISWTAVERWVSQDGVGDLASLLRDTFRRFAELVAVP